jgi:Flp pilus assembly protein TadG
MTFRNANRQLHNESGAALVEFALVLPMLLLLLFGLLDFGKAFNYWLDETHLANTAARWAAVNTNPGSGSLQSYTLSQADTAELRAGGSSTVPSPASVCITFPVNSATGTSGQVGDPVRVQVSVRYNWLPFIGSKLTTSFVQLTGSATMRLEAVPSNYTAGCS